MIDELQHRMTNVKQQYEKEIEDLEKKNGKKEKALQEEVKELEREVAEKKEMIQVSLFRFSFASVLPYMVYDSLFQI